MMFAASGKARAFLASKCQPGITADCSWFPEWKLTITTSSSTEVVGSVVAGGTISWDEQGCTTACSLTATVMAGAFVEFEKAERQ